MAQQVSLAFGSGRPSLRVDRALLAGGIPWCALALSSGMVESAQPLIRLPAAEEPGWRRLVGRLACPWPGLAPDECEAVLLLADKYQIGWALDELRNTIPELGPELRTSGLIDGMARSGMTELLRGWLDRNWMPGPSVRQALQEPEALRCLLQHAVARRRPKPRKRHGNGPQAVRGRRKQLHARKPRQCSSTPM